MLSGATMFGSVADPATGLDSHMRYLSGLLLGIGLAFAATIPQIERHGARFRLLCGFVVLGGFGRAAGLLLGHDHGWTSFAALAMELAVTPCLTLWQHRIASSS